MLKNTERLLCTILVVTMVFFSGCNLTSNPEEHQVQVIELTPEMIVEDTLDRLLSNDYDEVSKFGGYQQQNMAGKTLYSALFEKLTYNVMEVTTNSDGSVDVQVEITNRDLREEDTIEQFKAQEGVKMFSPYELQLYMANVFMNVEDEHAQQITVHLEKGAKGYVITNKAELFKVASGGYIGKE